MEHALFDWVGKDRNGEVQRGQTRALDPNQVKLHLHRQYRFATRNYFH